ncbi:hypothetical protein CY35_15G000800 [Sphagnum magellanicum]|jgi:hypothetical protein|nr:hypothetical protein CY35_15G000800 [Sphagnum magellanicum]
MILHLLNHLPYKVKRSTFAFGLVKAVGDDTDTSGSKSFIGGALKNFKAMTMASSDGYVV